MTIERVKSGDRCRAIILVSGQTLAEVNDQIMSVPGSWRWTRPVQARNPEEWLAQGVALLRFDFAVPFGFACRFESGNDIIGHGQRREEAMEALMAEALKNEQGAV